MTISSNSEVDMLEPFVELTHQIKDPVSRIP